MCKVVDIKDLCKKYKSIIEPTTLISNFKTKTDFLNWLQQGTKTDLKATLTAFENSELYEYCTIIKSCIKKNE